MNVIYYYHVPKCGGTFIFENLKRIYEKTKNAIFFNCYKDYYCESSIVVKDIPNLNYEYVYIYHHHSQHGLKDIISELEEAKKQVKAKGGEFYLFTCLRKTISFVNSHVNYINDCGNLAGSLRQDIKFMNSLGWRDKWNFDTAINDSWFNNYQSKYLLHNHVSNWKEDIHINQENIIEIVSIIDKIYTTESIIELKADLQTLVPNVNSEWQNKKINTSAGRLKMTKEQENKLIDKNQLDIWLYNNIKND